MENGDPKNASDTGGIERRREERVLIDKILQGYVLRGAIFVRVEIEDISKSGVAFLVKREREKIQVNEEIKTKLFIKDTDIYFLCTYQVLRVTQDKDGGFRHSCILTPESPNIEAISSLVGFIKSVNIMRGKQAA
jgi:hypothetical protein